MFHYGLFTNAVACDGQGIPSQVSGIAEIPGDDFIVAMGQIRRDVNKIVAGTFMHELGHNLGLQHGGGDNVNFKPNYLSVMNYSFQFSGVGPNWTLNYSDTTLTTLDEEHLIETDGIGIRTKTKYYIAPLDTCLVTLGEKVAIDWNFDGVIQIGPVSADVNNCEKKPINSETILKGYDDWRHLDFHFRKSDNFALGRSVRLATESFTEETAKAVNAAPLANAGADVRLITRRNEVPVQLDGSLSSDPDGSDLVYKWKGPGLAPDSLYLESTIPTKLSPGNSTFVLKVSDHLSESVPDTVNFSITREVPLVVTKSTFSVDGSTKYFSVSILSGALEALGFDDFDAKRIDPLALTLDGKKPFVFKGVYAYEDVNQDGKVDLTIRLELANGQINCLQDSVEFRAKTFDNVPVVGSTKLKIGDCIISSSKKVSTPAPSIRISPNPAGDEIWINLSEFSTLGGGTLSIYSSNGQKVHHVALQQVGNSSFPVNTKNMPSGVFVVELRVAKKRYLSQLIINH